jgi:dihydroorotate dehydrogenase (fumarate)
MGGWTQYARRIEEAGADAIELNIYTIPTDTLLPGVAVEDEAVGIVKAVRQAVALPIAVKVSPYYSNFAHMAKRLQHAGAGGLVLFNRFYQPDVDLELLEINPHVLLSTPQAMRLPLTWIGILYGRVAADLAATGGIHTAPDVIKMLMVGAHVTMLCSVLLENGIEHLRVLERDLRQWMERHDYTSVGQMRGSMSQTRCHNPAAFERAQYMRAVQHYRP